jgi:hypothetical protein
MKRKQKGDLKRKDFLDETEATLKTHERGKCRRMGRLD